MSEPRARALPTPSPLNCIKGFPIRQHVPRCLGAQTSVPSPPSENQHFTLATGQPHKRTDRTFHAFSAGQPTLAQPTRRLRDTGLCYLCPCSQHLPGLHPPLPPDRWGPSPSIAPRQDTTENHTRAMRRCGKGRGEPTALGYLFTPFLPRTGPCPVPSRKHSKVHSVILKDRPRAQARGGAPESPHRPVTRPGHSQGPGPAVRPSWGCWALSRCPVLPERVLLHRRGFCLLSQVDRLPKKEENPSHYEGTTKWSEETFSSFRCHGVSRSSEI